MGLAKLCWSEKLLVMRRIFSGGRAEQEAAMKNAYGKTKMAGRALLVHHEHVYSPKYDFSRSDSRLTQPDLMLSGMHPLPCTDQDESQVANRFTVRMLAASRGSKP